MKEESENIGLQLNILKPKIISTSWQIKGEKVVTVTDFLFLDSQITADGDCSHGLKEACSSVTNLDRVLKSRDITLLTKVHLVKVMFISVVMYGCESWIIQKLSAKELMLLNCGAWMRQMNCESLGQQGDPTSPFRESTLNIHRKD